jgi:hypothetical protein
MTHQELQKVAKHFKLQINKLRNKKWTQSWTFEVQRQPDKVRASQRSGFKVQKRAPQPEQAEDSNEESINTEDLLPPIYPMFETDQTDVLAETNETAATEEPTLAVTEEPTLADTTIEEPFLVEDVTDDEEEEESKGYTQWIGRELRSLGIETEDQVTNEVRNLNTHYYSPTFYVAST